MSLHLEPLEKLAPETLLRFAMGDSLLTAGSRESLNTMTIGWCQVGRLWSRPVCTVYVRPERHTYSFMEREDFFTVSLLPEKDRDLLTLCGTRSGRDVDKVKACGLTLCRGAGDAPFFAEAEAALVCRKLYARDLEAAGVQEGGAVLPFYGEKGGWHRMYVGEIAEAYTR